MIYSKTCEYGLRALTHLSGKPEGVWTRTPEISRETGVPGPYIAKIFQSLVAAGILKSCRGPLGGFTLNRAPQFISIMEVVQAIDTIEPLSQCVMGLDTCQDDNACPVHEIWKEAKARTFRVFETMSLKDFTEYMSGPRYRKLQRGRLKIMHPKPVGS